MNANNILLNDDCEPLIANFGQKRIIDVFEPRPDVYIKYWYSPEVISSGDYDDGEEKSAQDVYSYGMLVLYLMTGVVPWASKRNLQILRFITNHEKPEIPEYLPETISYLITECLDPKPSSRPAFEQNQD